MYIRIMGNSVSAPPPVKIIIHHCTLDEPIVTTISDPNETYSSLTQRIVEADFYRHCKLLPLLQSIHPTKLSAYQLLFGGNRALIVKPSWSAQEDEACLDVNVSLAIREANNTYGTPPSPTSRILNTLPNKYAPDREGRRPTLELEMVCTKIRKFGSVGPYFRVDDTLTKLIKCEPHPEGGDISMLRLSNGTTMMRIALFPKGGFFDSDEEEEVDSARATTGEKTRNECSGPETNITPTAKKSGSSRKRKKKSKASGSQSKVDTPSKQITEAGKANVEVDTSQEPNEIQTKNTTEKSKSADPKLVGSQTRSMASREEIMEAARVIAEDETKHESCLIQPSKNIAKTTTTNVKGSHPTKNESTVEIAHEAKFTPNGATSKKHRGTQLTEKATKKNKNADSRAADSQTKTIASREEIAHATKAISEEEPTKEPSQSQPAKKAAKKKKGDSKSSGSQSKEIASRVEILEAAKAIAGGETSQKPSDTQTNENGATRKNVDSNLSDPQTRNITSREEIIEAGKAIARENAKNVEMNGQFHEDDHEPSKPSPTTPNDDESRANAAAEDKKSNSKVSESRSKAKRRKKNETKRALEEAAVSDRITGHSDENMDVKQASSGSPSKTKSRNTATNNGPTKTAVEKSKTRVRSESVSNGSPSKLISAKKQKVDDGLSSTHSPTKVKSGEKEKTKVAVSEASGQGGKDKPAAKKGKQKTKPLQSKKTTDSSIPIAESDVSKEKSDLMNEAPIAPAKPSSQNGISATSPKSPKTAGKMVSHLEHSPHRQSPASQKQSSLDAKNVPNDELLGKKRISKPSMLSEKDAGIPAEPLKGFPEGWSQRRFPRTNASGGKHKEDSFFYTPKMKIKLRSKTQAQDLLAKLAETGGDEILAWQMMRTGKVNTASIENKDKKRKRTRTVEKSTIEDNSKKEDVNANIMTNASFENATSPPKKKAKSGKSEGTPMASSKLKAGKDPDKPKQPQNSFLLYANSVRSKVAADNPTLNGHEVASDRCSVDYSHQFSLHII
ncbi:LOW QUALITY PROTEIN: hypothetical protein HJC23_001935 [Cyclotella cryptica]|uniref:Uncharacterized protein n=1 Tax=Cyclotella cryptica TaxID=29204 RepID=A0ABD3PC29_9STRA